MSIKGIIALTVLLVVLIIDIIRKIVFIVQEIYPKGMTSK